MNGKKRIRFFPHIIPGGNAERNHKLKYIMHAGESQHAHARTHTLPPAFQHLWSRNTAHAHPPRDAGKINFEINTRKGEVVS